jgi:hypothetical protein
MEPEQVGHGTALGARQQDNALALGPATKMRNPVGHLDENSA